MTLMSATRRNPNEDQRAAGSLQPDGSANWDFATINSINMWTWNAKPGVRYVVTQSLHNIQAHLTTGTAHKFTRTIGSYATVAEARQRCVEHWQNGPDQRPGAENL